MVLPIFSFVARMMCLAPPFFGNSLLQLRSSPRPPQEAQEVTDLLLNYPHVTASILLLLQGWIQKYCEKSCVRLHFGTL